MPESLAGKLPLFPEQGSTMASQVDALYFFLIGVSIFFGLLIAGLLVTFAIRFRRRTATDRPPAIHGSLALELTWTLIPFGLTMIMFFWGASLFASMHSPPDDALDVWVVGKQWMWKLQHREGRREIDELHVPVGKPVKLIMTSEDVIHSFYVPAFRVKQDVLPDRYTTMWFEATKPGSYHLFCAEYCGTQHSGMIGWVIAMEPAEYQAWLSGGGPTQSLAAAGADLFKQLGCVSCHSGDSGARGPALAGLFGKTVQFTDGRSTVVDEAYVRESILNPQAHIVAGYGPIMPTFKGLVSEDGLAQLVAYIKALGPATAEAPATTGGAEKPVPQG